MTKIIMAEGSLIVAVKSADRFMKLDDGWIKDSLLGIDWGPSSTETMKWEAAKKYCADLGGRLPERFELLALVDDTKRDPATFPIFTDTKTDDWYWTGTIVAGSDGHAWFVNFYGGSVGSYCKGDGGYVRPVCSSQ